MTFTTFFQRYCIPNLVLFMLLTTTLAVPHTTAQKSSGRSTTHPRIHTRVLELADEMRSGTVQTAASDPRPGTIQLSETGEIGVEIRVRGSTVDAVNALVAQGVRVGAWSAGLPLVGAWVRPDQFEELAALPMVIYVDPMLTPVVRTGDITTAGDEVLGAAAARETFDLSGAGVRVGVISDGVQGLALAQNNGELPLDCPETLLESTSSCVLVDPNNAGSGNEGRAMLEIIHDLAPGAILGFASGTSGVPSFVAAIDFLQNEFQADVIVDDIGYLNEPFFENGTIGTRAQEAVDAGVVFVSAAGNDGQGHYQAVLDIPAGCPTSIVRECLHRFASDDTSQSFTLEEGESLQVYLQWDNPFDNATDDLDLYLMDGSSELAKSDRNQLLTKQPFEFVSYTNSSGATQQVDVVVDAYALDSGTTPEVEMLFIAFDEPEYLVSADSIYGHPGMPGVLGIGAVDASSADTASITIRSYSSQGPVTIGYPAPETRNKPDLVATDCVETSTPGFKIFCGTSAAAPHIAGLAALLLEHEPSADPDRIRTLLEESAIDAGEPGFDLIYGAGLPDTLSAVYTTVDLPLLYTRLPLILR